MIVDKVNYLTSNDSGEYSDNAKNQMRRDVDKGLRLAVHYHIFGAKCNEKCEVLMANNEGGIIL